MEHTVIMSYQQQELIHSPSSILKQAAELHGMLQEYNISTKPGIVLDSKC